MPAVEESMVVETVRRGRLAEYAYEYTKRMLFDGRLAPGAKLRVEDVVASLQTSRQPVMDAFKRLASEGYLEITPQVGCRVVVPGPAEISDFFLILGAVQGLAADIAAGRHTLAELATLSSIADAIDALRETPLTEGTARTYHALDHDFQAQIRAMSHSDAVASLANGLLDRRDFYITCVANGEMFYAERLREARSAHRSIVDAIAAGNAESARSHTESLILALGQFNPGSPARA